MNTSISYTKEIIKNANAIINDPQPIVILNPTFSAIFMPNDKKDIVIIPNIGNIIDMKLSVTLLSLILIQAAT